ncbi:MAG: PAS domain S-box protein [Deltaproteobacteria bacterium]|nr:PAS domain S-box protein [Deltaproteobacteria bacterium]
MLSTSIFALRIIKLILISAAFFFAAESTWAEASTERVRVGIYDIDPLCRTETKGENGGLFIELFKHIASREQWDIDYVEGSLDECLEKLGRADIDLLAAAAYSKEKAMEYDFTRETVISTWGQVYSAEKAEVGSFPDLAGLTVGVVRDDPYNQGLRETLKRFNVECKFVEFNHSGEVFRAIEKGWVDAGVVDRLYDVRRQGEYGVKRTPIVLSPVELRFAVPKGQNRNLIDALDYHLKDLKGDPDSIYYGLLNQTFGISGNSRISGWLIWGIGIALVLSIITGGMGLALKRRVRIKTAQLSKKNHELNAEILMRREARKSLSQSEARYRSLVENTLDGYYIFEYPSGKILFLNERICELLGYTRGEACQKSLWEFISTKDQEVLKKKLQSPLGGQPMDMASYTCTAVRKDGYSFSAQTSVSVVNDQGKTVIQGTLRDITEQERLKQHLQHAEKMEAVGTLAGGVAHDFNNLLMAISGNASLLTMDLDPSHPHYERLKHIEEYVQSGSTLTRQLLGFARGGKYEVKALNLNEVIEKTSHMFGRTRKEITIHSSYDKNCRAVQADQGQIEQVLLNMYVNAGQAMPSGGDLYFKTENVTVDKDHIRAQQGKKGEYVRISITDTGVGMDEKTRKRIFEPFFTTREIGRGTGLGLASAYGIIKNHGGFIDVYSEKGKGTTFSLYLPAAKPETMAHDGNRGEEMAIQKGEGTVLVVDDEEMIVEVGVCMLEKIGYNVLVARSGEEALKVYKEKEGLIDMVVLDMVMPGMGGGETFEGLKRIDRSVKVLLSSGYSINKQATEILNRGCLGFIQKPFSMAALSRKLKEVASTN